MLCPAYWSYVQYMPTLELLLTLCAALGVCFYQKESLPGYSAIFKHPNDELNYCYYLIPHGKDGYCGDVHVCTQPWCYFLYLHLLLCTLHSCRFHIVCNTCFGCAATYPLGVLIL